MDNNNNIDNQQLICKRFADSKFLSDDNIRNALLVQIEPKWKELRLALGEQELDCLTTLKAWARKEHSTIFEFARVLMKIGLAEVSRWMLNLEKNPQTSLVSPVTFSLEWSFNRLKNNYAVISRQLVEGGQPHNALDLIASKLVPCQVLALHGVGGAGKTTLARVYFDHSNYFIKVWIDVSQDIEGQMKAFLRDFNIPLTGNTGDTFKKFFEDIPNWLIVFDNAHDIHVLKHCPQGKGHVLITSRSADWKGVYALKRDELLVDNMNEEECLQLLDIWIPDLHEGNKKKLAEKLRFLPLALATTGAYMRECAIDNDHFKPFFAKLEKNLSQYLRTQDLKRTGQYHETMYGTLMLSYEGLSNDAKDMIDLLALVGARNVPVKLLRQCFPNLEEEYGRFQRELYNYHLISVDRTREGEETLSMHDLIHDIMEDNVQKSSKFSSKRDCIMQALTYHLQQYDWNNAATALQTVLFVPHAAHLSSHHTEDISQTQSKLQLDVKIATFYLHYQRRSADALTLLNERDLSQCSNQVKAEVINHLAFAHQQLIPQSASHADDAIRLSKQVIAIAATDSSIWWEEAFAFCILALAYYEKKDYSQAESNYETALSMYEKKRKYDHTDTQYLRARNRYGCIKLEQEAKIQEAEQVCKEVNEEWKKLPGYEQNEYVARNLISLGKCCQKLGKSEAQQYFQGALKIFNNIHGSAIHPGKGEALLGLGETYLAEKNFEASRECLETAKTHLTGKLLEKCSALVQNMSS